MPKFFREDCLSSDTNEIVLHGEDAHHVINVLRMRLNEEIIVCDGARTDITTAIDRFEADCVYLRVISREENSTEPKWQAWLFQGLPKGDKMDTIIQKAVELGVYAIVPVNCNRSVVRLTDNRINRRLERWNKISLEAARQCGRGTVPKVHEPVDFQAALAALTNLRLSFFPWENERSRTLKTFLNEKQAEALQGGLTIGFLIGPEGGFSAAEVRAAEQSGISSVTLGPRILRTETAAPAVLAMLGYQYDQDLAGQM